VVTVPVFDASESGSSEQEAAARRFERLARVRALKRARRRRYIVLAALVVVGLGGGVALVRGVWSASSNAPAAEPIALPPRPTGPARSSVSSAPTREGLTPPDAGDAAAHHALPKPSAAVAPTPSSRASAAPPAAAPPQEARDVSRRRTARPATPAHEVNAIPRAAIAEPEDNDGTAIIDWLLHAPRMHGR